MSWRGYFGILAILTTRFPDFKKFTNVCDAGPLQIAPLNQWNDDLTQHLVPVVEMFEKFNRVFDLAAALVVMQIIEVACTRVEMADVCNNVERIDALGIGEANDLAEHGADALGDALRMAGESLSPAWDVDDLRIRVVGEKVFEILEGVPLARPPGIVDQAVVGALGGFVFEDGERFDACFGKAAGGGEVEVAVVISNGDARGAFE